MAIEAPKFFGNFRKDIAQHAQDTRPSQVVLTEDQKRELGVQATTLLRTIIQIASPFMPLEDLNQKEERRFVAIHITPPVPITENVEDGSAQPPYYFAMVQAKRYVDLLSRRGDQIGPETVEATIFIKVPESEYPIPVVLLEGMEITPGNLVATEVTTAGFSQEEPLPNQLDEIKDALRIANSMKEYFDANPSVRTTVNGRDGHIICYTSPEKNLVAFIPRKPS